MGSPFLAGILVRPSDYENFDKIFFAKKHKSQKKSNKKTI